MFVPMANVLVEGATFEIRKIDVSKRHLLRAVKTPPYPLPKKQLLFARTDERTDFGQSNLALSNVRALRAIRDGFKRFSQRRSNGPMAC